MVAAPRLSVETREVNLGVLKVGETREFDLHLENQGMRLLYGSVSCAEGKHVWLSLGDTRGTAEKHFQFGHDQSIKVKVCGDRLRASSKPLVAKLDVESNGGSASITVRAEVHVKPFSGGALSDAKSPAPARREGQAPSQGGRPYFERGEVEAWYKTNGWTYPVQGPAAAGLQAIQQFFEALGLVKPRSFRSARVKSPWPANPATSWPVRSRSKARNASPFTLMPSAISPGCSPTRPRSTRRPPPSKSPFPPSPITRAACSRPS